MKKLALTFAGLLALTACASQEQLIAGARDKCSAIGYEAERERVPTLQCVERQFNRAEDRQGGPATSIAAGVAVVAIGSSL